jgi:hypothetical protein
MIVAFGTILDQEMLVVIQLQMLRKHRLLSKNLKIEMHCSILSQRYSFMKLPLTLEEVCTLNVSENDVLIAQRRICP